ncbi:ZMYM1 protein%2C partial [Scomber scombrus]|uniref:ZMYM1 protein, partial n=1 Tax=Scomber scombrus TaxID=13677 RepID=A0AAV1QD96_SCOSC
MAEGGEKMDLVADLLSKPFSRRTFQEKLDVVKLYTFVCLAVTIPVSTASVERTFSALKRIKTYARNTTGQARLSALASMAIEKDFLMELKRKDNLHNKVIELFLRKERRMDFVYK